MNTSPLTPLGAAAASTTRHFSWLNLFMVVLLVTFGTGLRDSLLVQVALFAVIAGTTCAMLFTIHMNMRAARAETDADVALLVHAAATEPRPVTAAAA